MVSHIFISFSTVQIYDLSFIHLHLSLLRAYYELCDQLPDGLIAQLVEHCTGIAEIMGWYPLSEFYSGFNFNAAKLCI